jgi:thioredoxin reductase
LEHFSILRSTTLFCKIQTYIEDHIFATANGATRRPQLNANNESNIAGLFIVGDLAGAPVIKLAMEQGYNVIEHIASLGRPDVDSEVLDLVIVGAGAAGLNAALAAQEKGLTAVLLEKAKITNTIENFPEGKWVYAEPDSRPQRESCGWTAPRKRI